ncbi:MAG: NUDIX domain-containing protein [Acidobacteria bacterium]|nr:NUDIX domain-containing protein [Acidobacteriota bacterium]
MNLLVELASKLWRRVPKQVRRWGVLLAESRFTVTVGAVVTDATGRVLLLEHRFRPGTGWGIPGGFIKPGEQPETAIRRELREEIGLEVEQIEIAFVRALERYKQIEILFRCHPQGDVQSLSREICFAEWFALDALPQSLSRDQRMLIERALNLKPVAEHLHPDT